MFISFLAYTYQFRVKKTQFFDVKHLFMNESVCLRQSRKIKINK